MFKRVFNNEKHCVDYFWRDDNNRLAFTFSSWLNRELEGSGFGGEFLLRNGYDIVVFKSNCDDWFQSLPEHLFREIQELISHKVYIKKMTYGASMGGFAAVAFSKVFDVETCLALSPQFSINELFDQRWASYGQSIEWKYAINEDAVSENCIYYIVYDNKDLDDIHAKKIAQCIKASNVFLVPLSYCGHSVAAYLHEVDELKKLLNSVCSGDDIRPITKRKNKSSSASYLANLSLHLKNRKKLKLSFKISDKAIKIRGDVSWFFYHRADVLLNLGQFEAALEELEHAIQLDPKIDRHGLKDRILTLLRTHNKNS